MNTSGERVFDNAVFEDGDRVSDETFFALLFPGDFCNDSHPIGIDATTNLNRALTCMDSVAQQNHLDQIFIEGTVYLFEILERPRP